MLISEAVHIWREQDGDFHVEWRASDPDTRVTVEPLAAAEMIAANYAADRARLRLASMVPNERQYFRLRDQHGTEVVAPERKLHMEGTPNFRDFGGYRGADGRPVKWGFLFRSGQLSNLSEADVALLGSLQLDLICDFRREEEQDNEPSRLPRHNAPRLASLPIVPGSNSRFFEEAESENASLEAMFDFMVEINRDFVEAQADTYGRMFREILEIRDARFLVHCAAGKDRTGFAAAIILLALGVSRDVVMHDYMLTQRFFHPHQEIDRLRKKYDMEHMDAAAILPMLEVREPYLAQALDAIDQNFPSVGHYLEDALGVGAAELVELRARYLN